MPSILPVDLTTTTRVTRFEIDSINVALFSSASIRVNIFAGNYRTEMRVILLSGDDYTLWGNNDAYITSFIASTLGFTVIADPIVEPVVEPIVEPVVEPIVEPAVEPVV